MTTQTNPPTPIGPWTQTAPTGDLVALLSQKVVGQSAAMKYIVPYVYMWQAGLAPEGRPAGVFLLLGPTGTGKTRTVEAIAELLHGSDKNLIKIDCGEFQSDHETAKLIGAPPGYLGHGETVPVLTQKRLTEVTSENSNLGLVLFDEIEKASQSVTRLLLGILDKGTLRLGDNSVVNFEKSLIFFTSNLGAREMMKEFNPEVGFRTGLKKSRSDLAGKLENIALGVVRKRFSPEFINRIDAIVTYQPLDQESLDAILDHDITALQKHVSSRLGDRCFEMIVEPESRQLLLRKGTSEEYGARELKRTIHRELVQPLATLVARGGVARGSQVRITLAETGESLAIVTEPNTSETQPTAKPSILIVDDNRDLLMFLAVELEQAGWQILTAGAAADAREIFSHSRPSVVLIDYMLGEDDGLLLGLEFQAQNAQAQIIMMTGGGLSGESIAICDAANIPVLYKPFLASDILNLVRGRIFQSKVAVS